MSPIPQDLLIHGSRQEIRALAEKMALTMPFDEVDPQHRCGAYDVEYVRLREPDGGELFVTRYGWHLLHHLLPEHWYANRRYDRVGKKLPGGTAAVFRVPTLSPAGRRKDLVVRFSRFAEEVPIFMETQVRDHIPEIAVMEAEFSNPFEEFGHVMQIRRGYYSRTAVRIRTKRPLAIYCPNEDIPLWRLGRTRGRFQKHEFRLKRDQAQRQAIHPIELQIHKPYLVIYEWVPGKDAETFYTEGELSEQQLVDLTHRVHDELRQHRYWVLDSKPKHFILRKDRHGKLIYRHGQLAYVLIDFELLKPIPKQYLV